MSLVNNYLVTEGEMNDEVTAGRMRLKSGQSLTGGTLILSNSNARTKLKLYEAALPSNTSKVPVYQEYKMQENCTTGGSLILKAKPSGDAQSYWIDLGTITGNVSWATSSITYGTYTLLDIKYNGSIIYTQSFDVTTNPVPANITFTYTYNSGATNPTMVEVIIADCPTC